MNDDAHKPPSAPRPPDAATTVAVNYSRDVGWSGTVAMEIQRAGDSTLLATFNDDGRPEIGVWKAPLPPEKLDELVSRLRASGYQRLQAPAAMAPGTKTLALGERLAGQSLPVMHVFAQPHPQLGPVMAALAELRGALCAHPVRVLRGRAAWKAAEVERGGEAILDVTLTNAGTAPLELGNPLGAVSGWSGIRLAFKKRSEAAGGEEQRDLIAGELRAAAVGASAAAAPTVTLAPGQSLRFEARKKIDLDAGAYAVRFEYHNVVTRDGDQQFVGGTLQLDPGDLTVKRGSWWKVW